MSTSVKSAFALVLVVVAKGHVPGLTRDVSDLPATAR